MDRISVNQNDRSSLEGISVLKGLRVSLFMGSYAIFGGFLAGTGFFLMPDFELRILLLLIAVLLILGGAWWVKQILDQSQKRARLLRDGKMVLGHIIRTDKAFNPFSSRKDELIMVQFPHPNGQFIQAASKLLRREDLVKLRINTPVWIFVGEDSDSYFIPPEIGCLFYPDSEFEEREEK